MHPMMLEAIARTKRDEVIANVRRARLARQASAARRRARTDENTEGAAGAAMRHLLDRAPRRNLAIATGVEAFFAAAWFGWGQVGSPAAVAVPLAVGSIGAGLGAGLCLLVHAASTFVIPAATPSRPAARAPYADRARSPVRHDTGCGSPA